MKVETKETWITNGSMNQTTIYVNHQKKIPEGKRVLCFE